MPNPSELERKGASPLASEAFAEHMLTAARQRLKAWQDLDLPGSKERMSSPSGQERQAVPEGLSEQTLTEWKHRCEAATPEPWFSGLCATGAPLVHIGHAGDYCGQAVADHEVCERWLFSGEPLSEEADAAFIAAAREAVPALIAEVERLRAEVEHWQRCYRELEGQHATRGDL